MINVLILSAGTRNKIIQYFKKEFDGVGSIVAADMSVLAPAVYEADKFYQVPKMTDDGYIDVILDICKKEKIKAILTLIDPELSLLAKYERSFRELGIIVVGSNYKVCELCLNKWEMFKWLKRHGYRTAKSYIDKNDFYKDIEIGNARFPVFVKPICGSASVAVAKVHDKDTLDNVFKHNANLMIQEFLDGQEIGADVYVDTISREVVSIFTKKKLLMRAGETDKAVSFKDEKLFRLIETFVSEVGFSAQIDIDLFEVNGEYYISEVNPRFGGGYPHAYECGCNHMAFIKNNLKGVVNKRSIGSYDNDVYMMKYNEVMIKK